VRGGDTTRAEAVVVTVTALGTSERVPGRAGARPGDLVVVTGPLGATAVGFRAGTLPRPPLRIEEGRRLAQVATAMCDISDGIGADAAHIAARSGARVVLDVESIPLAAGATPEDLAFGEDYELLATTRDALGFTVVGRVEAGEGVEPSGLGGWQHFVEP
jgi:thiamine-monophosphate kinase